MAYIYDFIHKVDRAKGKYLIQSYDKNSYSNIIPQMGKATTQKRQKLRLHIRFETFNPLKLATELTRDRGTESAVIICSVNTVPI